MVSRMDVDRESAELITDACSSWRPICGAGVGLSKLRETVRVAQPVALVWARVGEELPGGEVPRCGRPVSAVRRARETVWTGCDRPGAGWHRLPGGRDVRGDRLTVRGLHAHVVLHRRLEHPRFSRVDVSAPNHQVHYFRAMQVFDLDEDVAGWLAEAYRDAALHS